LYFLELRGEALELLLLALVLRAPIVRVRARLVRLDLCPLLVVVRRAGRRTLVLKVDDEAELVSNRKPAGTISAPSRRCSRERPP
jgi:hypothetical protein